MSEINEAVQIIRVAYDGVEIAMKVGHGGISAVKKTIDVLIGLLDREKSMGQTSMRKLLKRGGDLQVLQFLDGDLDKVKKYAKKYGILYSVLPDTDRKDGLTEIIFHSEAVPRVRMLQNKIGGKSIVSSFEDFLQAGDEEKLNGLYDFFQKQKGSKKVDTEIDALLEKVGRFAMGKKSVSADSIADNFSLSAADAKELINKLMTIGVIDKADASGAHKVIMDEGAFQSRIKKYQELSSRIRSIAASQNTDMIDITIAKKMVQTENEHAIKTRVPGTWGENVRYLWLKKSDVMEIHNGKTLLAYLDKNKDYKLYSEDNRVMETVRGETLFTSHYDKVENGVRAHYEKVEKHEQVQTVEKARSR